MESDLMLSIVIPVFNTQDFLQDCVESVENNFSCAKEIILVNDGSTDGSLLISYMLQNKFSNITILDKDNSGVADTRNMGLKIAKGKFIMFLDSDDYVQNDVCSVLLLMEKHNIDVVRGWYSIFDSSLNSNISHDCKYKKTYICSGQSMLFKEIHDKNVEVVGSMYIYKRDFLVNNNILYPSGICYAEDHVFSLNVKISGQNNNFMSVPLEFFCYRYRSTSTTKNPTIEQALDIISVIEIEFNLIKQSKLSKRDIKYVMKILSLSFTQLVTIVGRLNTSTTKEFRHKFDSRIKHTLLLHSFSFKIFLKTILFFYLPSIMDRIYERKYRTKKQ